MKPPKPFDYDHISAMSHKMVAAAEGESMIDVMTAAAMIIAFALEKLYPLDMRAKAIEEHARFLTNVTLKKAKH